MTGQSIKEQLEQLGLTQLDGPARQVLYHKPNECSVKPSRGKSVRNGLLISIGWECAETAFEMADESLPEKGDEIRAALHMSKDNRVVALRFGAALAGNKMHIEPGRRLWVQVAIGEDRLVQGVSESPTIMAGAVVFNCKPLTPAELKELRENKPQR